MARWSYLVVSQHVVTRRATSRRSKSSWSHLVRSRRVVSRQVLSEHVGLSGSRHVSSCRVQSRLIRSCWSCHVTSQACWSHRGLSNPGLSRQVLSRWSRQVLSRWSSQVVSGQVMSDLGTLVSSGFIPPPPGTRHRGCRCGSDHAAPGRCEWLSPDTLPNRRPRQTRAPVPAGP